MEYKECFEIMGKDRNSYSKTDLEATFMRMKEDHMLNGQLKPAYNVQIAVENYFIVHGYVSSDRTDYNTLIPVLEKHKNAFGSILEEVTADSGYCSEKNLLYLKRNEISSYIKLQDHEKRKTHAYSEDISKYYNMRTGIFEDEQFYICHDGRELRHLRTESKEQDGYTQTFEVYGCADCSGCEHKARCLYKYDAEKDAEKNKVMKINEPAIDLGIVMAIVSSYKNRPFDERTIVFGEVGLSGEVRAVNMPEQRVAEAKKLGFETCIVPEVSLDSVKSIGGIKIIGVKSINEAIGLIE